jgi:hypothetical protein
LKGDPLRTLGIDGVDSVGMNHRYLNAYTTKRGKFSVCTQFASIGSAVVAIHKPSSKDFALTKRRQLGIHEGIRHPPMPLDQVSVLVLQALLLRLGEFPLLLFVATLHGENAVSFVTQEVLLGSGNRRNRLISDYGCR